jgi:hypothetical protein
MNFAPLTSDDAAALAYDLKFVGAAVEAIYPGTVLTGMPSDIEVLQRILDGGPYTDSAEHILVSLGTSLGDLLGRALGLEWVRYTDEHGCDLGLRYGQTSLIIFPRDMTIKRVEDGEQADLQHLYNGVLREIEQLVASGEYR